VRPYQTAVAVFGVIFVGIGIALVAVGYVLGILFVALGCGRLYLLRTRR
jgi:hypothetical protein